MPKFKQTSEILKLMNKKESIRNIGIIAHIDHGKTTMTDSLLAGAGLLPPQIAGKARVLDYLDEEQKRGITIKTANISLLHEKDRNAYLINLIDTPGHVDFTGKVTRALRAIDGAVVVVDAVEGVMVQTKTVTRQALEERVRPVLFVNKVDRLIKELKLTPDEVQARFLRIIRDFNNIIEIYGEEEFKEKWKVDPAKENVAFGSALHKWGFTPKIAKEKGIKFNEVTEAYKKNEHQSLSKEIPVQNAILDIVVKNVPNPAVAQKYRIPKIWKGKLNSEIGRAMLNCDDEGPTAMCITMIQTDQKEGLISTGRLFSGSVSAGDQIYLVNAEKEQRIEKVVIYMGALREDADKVSAGNIAALLGIDVARAGETLIDISHRDFMAPFERIKYASEPVVTVAIEPKHHEDLQRLLKAINRLSIEDPNLITTINKETGEYLLSGIGELHLEIAFKTLKEYGDGIEITTSKPTVTHRESVTKQGKTVAAKSPNKHNIVWVKVEPLEQETENVWALDENRNSFINLARDIENLRDVKESMVAGFKWACKAGPLCNDPLINVKVKLVNAQLHEDPSYRGSAQIMPAVRQAIFASFLTAKPTLLEPIYNIVVSVPHTWIGECTNIITRRRGKIVASEQKGALTVITGYIPVAESLGLSEEMRSLTSGHAFWQCSFDRWKKIPEKIVAETIKQIREIKGLPPETPKPEEFMNNE
ncbi:MAG: GTP-binding protein [Candidatus Bathycorpusculaceae bacterium]